MSYLKNILYLAVLFVLIGTIFKLEDYIYHGNNKNDDKIVDQKELIEYNIPVEQLVISPVVRINKTIITNFELDQKIEWFLVKNNKPLTQENFNTYHKTVLNQYILEKIYIQNQKHILTQVSNKQIQEQKQTILKKLELANTSKYDSIIIEEIKASIAWGQILQEQLKDKLKITSMEINHYLKDLQSRPPQTEYQIQLIFLPNKVNRSENTKLVNKLYYQLEHSNVTFEALYNEFNQGIKTGPNGNIGWVTVDALPIDLKEPVQDFITNNKSITKPSLLEPIMTIDGYYLVRINAERLMKVTKYPLVTYKVGGRNNRHTSQFLNNLKASSLSCEAFKNLANNNLEVNWEQKTIKPEFPLYKVIENLDFNETTDVMEDQNNNSLALYMLCDYYKTAELNQLQSYIYHIILQKKQMELVEKVNNKLYLEADVEIFKEKQ